MANPTNNAPSQLAAALDTLKALADCIRELKQVPAGHLYALAAMPTGMTLETFDSAIGLLVRSKLVERTNHLLRWVGPEAA